MIIKPRTIKFFYHKNLTPREMAEKAVKLWTEAKTKKQIERAKFYFRYYAKMSNSFLKLFDELYEKEKT